MTSRPGWPESSGFAAELKDIKRRLAGLERAARLTASSIGAGGLIVKDNGKIQFLAADGTVILEQDITAFTYSRSDGSRILEITPGGGLKIYATDGTTEEVVLDGDGLVVDGGVVRAIDGDQDVDTGNNASLTTTLSTLGSDITLTKPSWANSALVQTVGQLRVTDDAGGTPPFDIVGAVTVDQGGSPTTRSLQSTLDMSGRSQTVTVFNQKEVASPGSTIVTRFEARVTAGTNATNAWSHSTSVEWRR